ncbi:MAG TPA: hypothetical protein VFM07_01475 [Intrasporangium sp.]|nr:hypothetical protein [Intrasporangium sp.]
MKYTVDPHALNAAADGIARALDLVAAVRIDEDLQPLTHAFAGGVTVARLKATTNLWDVHLAGARAQLRILGTAMVEAADGYGGLESLTAQQLGRAGTGRRP